MSYIVLACRSLGGPFVSDCWDEPMSPQYVARMYLASELIA